MDILFIIKTIGLEYDDRVRKECGSIRDLGKTVKILVFDDKNINRKGFTGYKVPFISVGLKSRAILPQKKYLVIKILEMYIHSILNIFKIRPRVVWIHNIETSGLIPILYLMKKVSLITKIVWDQHELPPSFFLSKGSRMTSLLFKLCDTIIVANQEREEYLKEKLYFKNNNKFQVLENFPDKQFYDLPKLECPQKIKRWLDGSPFILAQGGASPNRYIGNIIEAILNLQKPKLIIVGPYNNSLKVSLEQKFGHRFQKFIYFTGLYPQMQLVNFIDHALASIILYNDSLPNSLLCASNRMYQSVIRGTPVIVGSNPPMAKFVANTRSGVVLKSDGQHIEHIISGINKILQNPQFRRDEFENNQSIFWESQINTIKTTIVE